MEPACRLCDIFLDSSQTKLHLVKDVRALGEPFDRAADDGLGMPQPVGGRRIDPIYSSIQSRVNRPDGFLVILRAPGEFPLSSADRPSPDAYRCNLQVTLSQCS